jgi:S1-C subfamily serine protease
MMSKYKMFVVAVFAAIAVVGTVVISQSVGLRTNPAAGTIASDAEVFPIFRESTYSIKSPRMILLTATRQVPVISSGSGFLLEVGGDYFVITASHVATGADRLDAITVDGTSFVSTADGATQINKASERIRLGYKSLIPSRSLHPSPRESSVDISVFAVDDPDSLGVRPLKPGAMKKGGRVVILGFPALAESGNAANASAPGAGPVSNAARREQTVTSREGRYFVTEGLAEVSSGFSGGPVLNDLGEVVGLAVRSNGPQTRCIYIDQVLAIVKEFARGSFAYAE